MKKQAMIIGGLAAMLCCYNPTSEKEGQQAVQLQGSKPAEQQYVTEKQEPVTRVEAEQPAGPEYLIGMCQSGVCYTVSDECLKRISKLVTAGDDKITDDDVTIISYLPDGRITMRYAPSND